ncbi:MAG: anthrone oxygenase family protein [Candidatus Thiodiazotropha sp.]
MDIDSILPYLVVAAIAGAGVITGLLFAFSNFVMRALAELQPDQGMFAMQQINEKIINPLFLLFFLGTPLLCLIIAGHSLMQLNDTHDLLLLAGSIGYLIGPFGITLRRNVPLNDELAVLQPAEGAHEWSRYQVNWQRWNHIRTYIGLISIIFLCLGLYFA